MKESFKAAAIDMVGQVGLINLDREKLCDKMGLAAGSFNSVVGMGFKEFVEELRQEGHIGPKAGVAGHRATSPHLRKDQIIQAALLAAKEHGFSKLSRPMVAAAAGVSVPLVTNYFGGLLTLKVLVMQRAVEQGVVEVVAEGLGLQDSVARAAPEDLKREAIKYLAK